MVKSLYILPDVFTAIYEIKGFLVAVNKNKLVIINPNGEIVVSEDGLLLQDAEGGKCISMRKDGVEGIYHYDGTLLVPFEFYRVFIEDADDLCFHVKKNKGDSLEPYTVR